MSQENVEVIQRATAVWNRGDLATLETFHSPDIEWRDFSTRRTRPGNFVESTRSSASGPIGSTPSATSAPMLRNTSTQENWVVCVTRWHGSGTASGASVDLRTVDTYEIRQGKIVRAVLADESKEQALEAVGLRE